MGRQEAQADWEIDDKKVLTLNGLLDNQAENPVRLNLSIDEFPLATANPFLPSEMAQLQGYLNGKMGITGSTDTPLLNGYIQMEEAVANSKSMGATLKFPQSQIRVEQNVLQFDNYEITGANKNPLHIDGNIDFKKLDKIVTDLRLYASAFQPVKSARSTKATVYGSVIADMDMAVNGPLDALKIRGNVGLLTGTEVTYVMQDSPFALQQQENNIVTFVSFNDSTEIAEEDTLQKSSVLGMDILVNINIAPTVKMGVNLSVDGKKSDRPSRRRGIGLYHEYVGRQPFHRSIQSHRRFRPLQPAYHIGKNCLKFKTEAMCLGTVISPILKCLLQLSRPYARLSPRRRKIPGKSILTSVSSLKIHWKICLFLSTFPHQKTSLCKIS